MWRADGVILNRKLRPSNEAVWGGNFEDLKDPERGIRALRIRTLATLADRHTQISFSLLTRTLHSVHIGPQSQLNLLERYTRQIVLSSRKITFEKPRLRLAHKLVSVHIYLAIGSISFQNKPLVI